LKYYASGTLATGFLFSSCEWMSKDAVVKSLWKYKYGRTPEEIIMIKKEYVAIIKLLLFVLGYLVTSFFHLMNMMEEITGIDFFSDLLMTLKMIWNRKSI